MNIIEAINLGAFYRFVNTRISNGIISNCAIVDEGLILTDNQDKANAFNISTSPLLVLQLLTMDQFLIAEICT